MKKTLLNKIPNELPQEILHFVSMSKIYDCSCSSEARVYLIANGNGYYLKRSAK